MTAPLDWPAAGFGLRYWRGVLTTWELIWERWAIEMGEEVQPVLTDAQSTVHGPELVAGAELAPDMPADTPAARVPHERQPAGLRAARRVRRTLTRTMRHDIGLAMIDMAAPGGWRETVLNPDLPDARKFAILSDRFDKITQTDDPRVLYRELAALAAVSAGWAQGIARRQWRDAKRRQRHGRRRRRAARRRGEDGDG